MLQFPRVGHREDLNRFLSLSGLASSAPKISQNRTSVPPHVIHVIYVSIPLDAVLRRSLGRYESPACEPGDVMQDATPTRCVLCAVFMCLVMRTCPLWSSFLLLGSALPVRRDAEGFGLCSTSPTCRVVLWAGSTTLWTRLTGTYKAYRYPVCYRSRGSDASPDLLSFFFGV